jgi:hypothetical protein
MAAPWFVEVESPKARAMRMPALPVALARDITRRIHFSARWRQPAHRAGVRYLSHAVTAPRGRLALLMQIQVAGAIADVVRLFDRLPEYT